MESFNPANPRTEWCTAERDNLAFVDLSSPTRTAKMLFLDLQTSCPVYAQDDKCASVMWLRQASHAMTNEIHCAVLNKA